MCKITVIITEPNCAPRDFPLEKGDHSLGRGQACDIVLADTAVSRKHAMISVSSGRAYVTDCDSAGGTYLNSKKIDKKLVLTDGDIILVGATKLELSVTTPVTAAADKDKTRVLSSGALQDLLKKESPSPKKQPATAELSEPAAADTAQAPPDATRRLAPESIPAPEEPKPGDTGKPAVSDTRKIGLQEPKPEPPPPAGSAKTVFIPPDALGKSKIISYHKLIILSKQLLGREFILDRPEITVGRQQECDIRINDETISTKHALIRLEGDQCMLEDSGSRNGTFVNGERIQKKKILVPGQKVKFGSVECRFVDKNTTLSREELLGRAKGMRPGKKESLIAALVLGLIVLLIAVISSDDSEEQQRMQAPAGVETTSEQETPTAESESSAAVAPQPDAAPSAEMYFTTAEKLMENKLWDEALNNYQEVLTRNPLYPGLVAAMQRAATERDSHQTLERAAKLNNAGKHAQIIAELNRIPVESIYYERARRQIASTQEILNQAEKIAARAAPPKAKPAPAKKTSAIEKTQQLIGHALKEYAAGNTKAALKTLNKVAALKPAPSKKIKSKARNLKKNIAGIDRLYKKGLQEYKDGRFRPAFQTWGEGLVLDQKILGKKKSSFAGRVAGHMADRFCVQAREALDQGDPVTAGTLCQKALGARPGHKDARAIQKLLDREAKRLYEEGYTLEVINPEQA
ncbi:MAG: FHA domain-containing protein, partial [Deltaproteobacteria bacterium]|nr:FHA domain-containing protein [Deltaproteobacteria bacterium]